jgi:hypothetical protein
MLRTITVFCLALSIAGIAQQQDSTIPRIWDDKAVADWATPIAALGVGPSQFSAAGPEDVARYAAFVTGTDPMEFGEHKLLSGTAARENSLCR